MNIIYLFFIPTINTYWIYVVIEIYKCVYITEYAILEV